MEPFQAADGNWYVSMGRDSQGQPVLVPVAPPGYVPIPESMLQPTPILQQSPAALATKVVEQPIAETVTKAKQGLFYREPEHGQWYQSIFLWVMVGVTVIFAAWWINICLDQTDWLEPDQYGHRDMGDVALLFFGWIWWGWMPLGIGVIGALQKAGYKRAAAAWSVFITAAIALFFARNQRTTKSW